MKRSLIFLVTPVAALTLAAAAQAAPTITITTPAAGAQYAQNSTVLSSYNCSGSTSCIGTVPGGEPIPTASAGPTTFTVTATGKQGRRTVSSSKSVTYTVKAQPAPCSTGYVALTYDDGPTTMTSQYLTALAGNDLKATFFDIGNNMQAYPDAVKAEVASGEALADHTMTHPDLTTLTDEQITAELAGQKQLARSIAGYNEVVYRPPYGAENGNTWNDAFALGLMETTWTYDTNDWQEVPTSAIVNGALANAHDQAIILMHDGRPNTLAAIPQIAAGLRAKGLCSGKIVQSWENPINNAWGYPMYVNVVPF
jgi:peptidoglycan/xylan/chitin deacetylase (PgdA/CDA1 family)